MNNFNDKNEKSTTGIAPVALFIAIGITLAITIYPIFLSTTRGKADHLAAMLMFWSMSAGYVRGVGFVPKNLLLRWLFGSFACLLALTLAICRLVFFK